MYKILRNILFLFDPESVHYTSMNILKFLCKIPLLNKMLRAIFSPGTLHQKMISGLVFQNPVGLGAGFDKNAKYLNELEILGFGFVEIGTVTPLAQAGNETPRLFRLPKDMALINRMGFNNDGAENISANLKNWRSKNPRSKLIIGGNIGKNKLTPNELAWKDYETSFHALHSYVDYFVVNVSSPNTPGLRELQEKDALHKILVNLQLQNKKYPIERPVFLKLAPDIPFDQLDEIVDLVIRIKLEGLIIANTTINRSNLITGKKKLLRIGAGGLSGKPVFDRSRSIIAYIQQKCKGEINIIASGGIFTATDARMMLDEGASLIQVWTGFIYEGPSIVKNICNRL